jgi:hypothetical protein
MKDEILERFRCQNFEIKLFNFLRNNKFKNKHVISNTLIRNS